MKKSVIAIIFSPDKKSVLTLKRCDVPIWVFPGGGVEEGESIESAVIREVFEETGLTVEILRLVGEYSPKNRLSCDTYVYECLPKSGQLSLSDETLKIDYFRLNHLPAPFFHVHKYWLDDALQFSHTPFKKMIRGTSYFRFVLYLFMYPLLMGRFILTKLNLTINTKHDSQ